jgi:aminodeoxyfutalosine synthase
MTFIPLAFHPENTGLAHLPGPSAQLDLRTIAIARLLLDNFDHVKTYWIMQSLPLSQVALGTAPTTSTARDRGEDHARRGRQDAAGVTARRSRRADPRGRSRSVERDTLYQRPQGAY